MTVFVLWVITFVLIAYFANKRWDSGVSDGLDKVLPSVLKTKGENRYLWVGALAILGATTLVRPVDILLVVVLLSIIGLIIMKLASWASRKTSH